MRNLSRNHCENYSEYLYQRGLMINKLHRQKSKEAEREKHKIDLGYAYRPQINEFSKHLVKDRLPLMDRTTEIIEQKRSRILQESSRSYKKHGMTSPKKSKNHKPRVVLDPEDYDNFFRKNIEWLNHKENKREILQIEQKRRRETQDRISMVPDKFTNSPDYFIDDPLYEDLYSQTLKQESDRGIARVAMRLDFKKSEDGDIDDRRSSDNGEYNLVPMSPEKGDRAGSINNDIKSHTKTVVSEATMIEKMINDLKELQGAVKDMIGNIDLNTEDNEQMSPVWSPPKCKQKVPQQS